jgi:hypothetical protein
MKESGEAQIGDEDHHAKQQGDGVEVDGAIRLLEAEAAARHHQAGTNQRRAGAVEAQPRQSAERDHDIGGGKDEGGGEHGDATMARPPRANNRKKAIVASFLRRVSVRAGFLC